MSGTTAIQALEEIRAVSGNARHPILKKHLNDNAVFREAMRLTYDPMITFGVKSKSVKHNDEAGESEFGATDFDILEKLRARELTGNNALETLSERFNELNDDSRQLFSLILDGSAKAGFSESSLNKAWKDFIYIFKTMLSKEFEEHRVEEFPVFVEEKFDGMRVVAVVQKDYGVSFLSRTGKPIDSLLHLSDALLTARARIDRDYIIDGEVVADSFNETVSQVRKKGKIAEDAIFKVFDAMPLAAFKGESVVSIPLEKRMKLSALIAKEAGHHSIEKVKSYKVNSHDEIRLINKAVTERGGEGVIVKIPGSPYEKKRSFNWMKIKAIETVDVPVIGAFNGEPGTKYEHILGGLIVDYNGVKVRVGGGFSDVQRNEFHEAYVRDAQRNEDEMDGEPVEGFEILNRIVEVAYHELTPDKSLRHPRFIRFRDSITGEKE